MPFPQPLRSVCALLAAWAPGRSNSHAGLLAWLVCLVFPHAAEAANISVCPSGCDHSSVQAAVDAASHGDVIEVSPGEFSSVSTNKTLTIVAEDYVESDVRSNTTTLNGSNTITAGGDVTLRGLRLIGSKPVTADGGRVVVEHCFVDNNGSDGISFEENGSGIVRNSIIDGSSDDNVDIDHQTRDILLEGNEFLNAGDDGIEARQHTDTIPSRVTLTIRSNRFEGSAEDGLQLMDYDAFSNRLYIIEGNLFKDVGAAGVGVRVGSNTNASPGTPVASMPEPLYLIHNTFVSNPEAVSGGGNTIALNNVFVENDLALRSVDTDSVLQNNLLFNNTIGSTGSNAATGTITSDPLLDSGFQIQTGSPGIGAGVAHYSHTYTNMDGGSVTDVVIDVEGAPDLGWSGIGGAQGGAGPSGCGEDIYQDHDVSGTVTVGDTRVLGFAGGSVVAGEDADVGASLVAFTNLEKHAELTLNGAYEAGEDIYQDHDVSGTVSVGDTRVLVSGFAGGSVVAGGDADIGALLVAFTGLEKHAEVTANGVYDAEDCCNDGLDNDGDGFCDTASSTCTDGSTPDDPGCADASDLDERSPLRRCDDGADNDGDGRIDFDPVTFADPAAGAGDPGCRSPTDRKESSACDDEMDNDGDSAVDWDGGSGGGTPDDGCASPSDSSELVNTPRCGLGFEPTLLLAPLSWLAARRNRGRRG